MSETVIKIVKEQGVRKYRLAIEFNTDRVISNREKELLLSQVAEALKNPKDFNVIKKENGVEIKQEVTATYRTIIIHKEITYHAVPNSKEVDTNV